MIRKDGRLVGRLKMLRAPVGLAIMATLAIFMLQTACSRAPVGNPEEGKRWFGLYRCSGCHGEKGGGGRAPSIRKTNLSFGKFQGKIRESNSSIMPSFSPETIPDQDIADIWAYLQSDGEEGK